MPYLDPEKQKAAQREWAARKRKANPEQVKRLRRKARSVCRVRNEAIINAFKSAGCSRCPEKNVVVLDCHHVDPTSKLITIGSRTGDLAPDRLRAELMKCIVLCANCHRKQHYAERKARDSNSSTPV